MAGVIFAGIIGWISYTDALTVTTLAGNGGGIAYAYPVIPDGLLFFSLLAAWEAARDQVPRSRWAVAGLVLGAGMTLAANTGAGLQRSVLDAVIDFLIPVCFFVAVEIVLWHVRRGRGALSPSIPGVPPATSARSVPSSVFEAAKVSMAETAAAGNPWSRNQLQTRFRLSRADADEIWQPYKPPAGAGISDTSRSPAGAAKDPPAAHVAGDGARIPLLGAAPAGPAPARPAGAMNGSGPHG